MRVVLVEDEVPARERLKSLLAAHPDVRVVAECGDGEEALERLRLEPCELVFLDVEMPGADGLEVAERLPAPRPSIVFCTAYERFAVEAFEREARDYLLKPVSEERLARALDRVRRARGDTRLAGEAEAARALQERRRRDASDLDLERTSISQREVSGDFDDVIVREGSTLLVVGDVGGKGVDAGLLASGLQAVVRVEAERGGSPRAIVAAARRWFASAAEDHRIATLIVAAWDPDEKALRWSSAGHPEGATSAGRSLPPTSSVLGAPVVRDDSEREIALEAGEAVAFVSDGIAEILGERLGTILREGGSAAERSRRILDAARRECGGRFEDDVTLLVARVP